MKKAIFITCSLALGAIVLINSCSKPYYMASTTTTSVSDPSGINALFAELRSTPQTFTVTAGVASSVTGSKGTILKFYPNSFKDANGHIITSGTVNLQLVEMYSAGDKIMNRANTMSGTRILESGGQITLLATMNGQSVFANKYSVSFLQAAASTVPMNLFYGNNNNADSTIVWGNPYTLADSVGIIAYGTTRDTLIHAENYYIFDSCTNFGNTNCDHFHGDTGASLTSVSALLPDISFNASNTEMYLILPSINSVMSNASSNWTINVGAYDSTTHTLCLISEGQKNIVPQGIAYKLVLICKKGSTYYYYETSGNVTANMKPIVAFSAKTYSQLVPLLQAL